MTQQQPEKVGEFLDTIRTNAGDRAADTGQRLVEWGHEHDLRDVFYAKPNLHGMNYQPVVTGIDWSPVPYTISDLHGEVWVQGDIKKHKPFNQEAKFRKLFDAVQQIPGMIPKDYYPHITLEALSGDEAWVPFTEQMDWMIAQIKKFNR